MLQAIAYVATFAFMAPHGTCHRCDFTPVARGETPVARGKSPPTLPSAWAPPPPSPWTSAKASHILLKDAPYEDESAKVRAAALIAEINAGTLTFAEVAASLSHCPSGKRAGGSLGEFTPGRMVPPFDAAVFRVFRIFRLLEAEHFTNSFRFVVVVVLGAAPSEEEQ